MANYYAALKKALKIGDVTRITSLEKKKECLIQNNEVIYGEALEDDGSLIVETIKPEVHLVLFGAGHIAKAIHDIATILKMKITVLDEREETLNEERFPYANRILMPYEKIFKTEFSFFRPYFIILTHGHAYDKDALRYCLSKNYSYIGMIGSRGKVAATKNALQEEGFDRALLDSIHSPIGLSIGAETPEEIAISIISEVIQSYRSEKSLVNLNPDYLESVKGKKGISVRIIEKHGSAPRAVGSEIFITEDETIGTIGGGAIEKNAIDKARTMLKNDEVFSIFEHSLSSKGDLGMICGGNVKLLYQLRLPE